MDIQALVNAQTHINRSVFQANRKQVANGYDRETEEYILSEISEAIQELKRVQISITRQPELFNHI